MLNDLDAAAVCTTPRPKVPLPPLGARVVARHHTGVCTAGEPGVVYELYSIGNRPGASVIFASGRYDGFSGEEMAMMLRCTGEIDEIVAQYQYSGDEGLRRDYERGVFEFAQDEAGRATARELARERVRQIRRGDLDVVFRPPGARTSVAGLYVQGPMAPPQLIAAWPSTIPVIHDLMDHVCDIYAAQGRLVTPSQVRRAYATLRSARLDGETHGLGSPSVRAFRGDVRNALRVAAQVRSDDGSYDIPFDCTAWFEQATEKEIAELCARDWRGGDPGDRVALYFEDAHARIGNMLIFCRASQGSGTPIGFECHVDADSATAWISVHRPSVAKSLGRVDDAASAPKAPRSTV